MPIYGYRSISLGELQTLFDCQNPVYGCERHQNRPECGCPKNYPYGIVCFFAHPYRIVDKNHKIDIVVELDKPLEGWGSYNVCKNFSKTRTYRYYGKYTAKLKELYVRSYSAKDIISINLRGNYANWFNKEMEDKCKELGIGFHNRKDCLFDFPPNYMFINDDTEEFLKTINFQYTQSM